MLKRNSIYLLFWLSIFSYRSIATVLEFEVKTKDVTSNYVDVTLKATAFQDHDKIGFEYNPDRMYRFRVYDLDGNRIKYQRSKKQIKFKPKEKSFFIKYRVRISSYKKFKSSFEFPNFKINDSILLFGYNTFITPISPETVSLNPSIYIKFRFPHFWKIVSSWGLKGRVHHVIDIKSLMEGLILAGNLEIEKTKIKNKNYYLLFIGDLKGVKQRLSSLYRIIATKQVDMWNFLPADFMIVALLKDKSLSIGTGFQYTNAIIYFLPEEINLQDVDFLKWLAHEHFHIWNGLYLKPREMQLDSVKWFHEGVTDYYALMTLISAGLIDEKAFLTYLAKSYLKYDSSDANLDFFPIFAIEMEIYKATRRKRSFDNILKNMSAKSSFWERGYNNTELKLEIARVANWDAVGFFDKFIYRKEKLDLKPYFDYLGLGFSVKVEKVIDQGFSIKRSKKKKVVQGIKKSSVAYKAGVRNGDIIVSIDKPKKPGENIKIEIRRRKKKKEFSFSPLWKEQSKLVLKKDRETKAYSKWISR